ncbi:MAG: hypothetical protein GY864_13820 [Desulfobacterales bacterium]|nr:hypothetical protein [Desulfobacterales bacterium]
MVLSLMRKHAKSWLIKTLLFIIAIVFIFYFGYSFNAKKAVKVAYVNGELINEAEYRNSYYDLLEMFQRQYKDYWNENLIKAFNLKKRALDTLIEERLITTEAQDLGMDVTEVEIQEAVVNYPAFKINEQFDMGRYRSVLVRNKMKPEDFEMTLAKDLLRKKLDQFLQTFMLVSDQEILDYYTYNNETMKIDFVRFKPDDFKDSVEPDDDSMKDFFEKNKQQYRVPEKIKIAYVEVDPEALKEQVEVPEKDITDYYEYNLNIYSSPKQVKARHILFKVAEDADEARAKKAEEEALSVLEQARRGKDFAELAKEFSQGPTKTKGGDLGFFSPGQMVKPFEDVAFGLKIGEISDPVRTPFGYHIIKVEDIKEAYEKTLDEVREQIVKTLTENAAADLAHEKGLSFIDQMPYDIDLAQYAAEHDLEAKETDYLSKNDPIPGIGADKKLIESIFALEQKEISDLIELAGKYFIFQVAGRQEPALPELEAVVDRVKDDFIDYQSVEDAKTAAEGYLAELKEGKSWGELAKTKGLKPEESDFFTRQGDIPKIGRMPDLQEAAFGLDKNKPYPDTVYEYNKNVYVVRWKENKGVDEKKYEKEMEQTRFSLMQTKHRLYFQTWLNSLKDSAEIEIVNQNMFN